MNNHHVLWYDKPAKNWEEALPIGNGRIGAMVYGGIECEQLSMNEDTLWSGYPKDKCNEDSSTYFWQARELLRASEHTNAHKLIKEKCLSDWTDAYQPMGDIFIESEGLGEISGYKRYLDMHTANIVTEMDTDKGYYKRQIFISHVNEVMIVTIEVEKPITTRIYATSLHPYEIDVDNEVYALNSQVPDVSKPSYVACEDPIQYNGKGMYFNMLCSLSKSDGEITYTEKGICVKEATYIELHYTSATSFNGYDKDPVKEGKAYKAISRDYLTKSLKKDVNAHLEEHIQDYSQLYNRCKLCLGEMEEVLPIDERLKKYNKGGQDVGLEATLYHYGRYLLIASSREGTIAANLQGIWNDKLRAPWSCNFTSNINVEMNYWHSQTTNLAECQKPLLELIKIIATTGEKTAKIHYNCEGFTAHHNIDIWGSTVPVGQEFEDHDIVGAAFWAMGGAWLAREMWEYYIFNPNEQFLREEAYPILKKACLFLYQYMYRGEDGKYYTGPSVSPENSMIIKGERQVLDELPTMDLMIIQDIFGACIKASEILEIDKIFANNLKERLNQMPEYKIGKFGELKEYSYEDYEYEDENHRHISHLYGIYPAQLIDENSNFGDACRTTLNRRGDYGTGWSLAWKINCWARLKAGDRCYKLIRNQLNVVEGTEMNLHEGGTYYNLLCAHPPMQIDGNFGYTSGVAEMLMQSTEKEIILLPAIPKTWVKGSIKGLKARGGATVSFKWDKEKIYDIQVTGNSSNLQQISYKGNAVKEYEVV